MPYLTKTPTDDIYFMKTKDFNETYVDRMILVCFFIFMVSSLLSISITQISFTAAAVCWAYKIYKQKNFEQIQKPLSGVFLVYIIFSFVSVVTSIDIFVSLLHAKKLLMIIIFFLFLNNVKNQNEAGLLVKVLIVTGVCISFHGFFQAYNDGISLATRVKGTMSIYMTFAGLLMIVNLMVCAKLIFDFNKKEDWWLIPALIIISVCLLFTLTRNAWVGNFVGVLFLLFLKNKKWLLFVPAVVVIIFFASPHTIQKRMKSIFDLSNETNRERIYMMQSGIKIVKDYPFFGCGLDCVKLLPNTYLMKESKRSSLGHLHNNIIQTAAHSGIIGLISWLAIWVFFFYEGIKIYVRLDPQNAQGKFLVAGSFATVVGFHAAGLFEWNFHDSEVIMLLYFMMSLPFIVDKFSNKDQKMV